MCGIFGIFTDGKLPWDEAKKLAKFAQRRGRDSSGLLWEEAGNINIQRSDFPLSQLMAERRLTDCGFIAGHSRLVTNGNFDNQPVLGRHCVVLHNGIITNTGAVWRQLTEKPMLSIDSEVICAIFDQEASSGISEIAAIEKVLSVCEGSISCCLLSLATGKIYLFSNTGSMFISKAAGTIKFGSEAFWLGDVAKTEQVRCPVCVGEINTKTVCEHPSKKQTKESRKFVNSLLRSAELDAVLSFKEHELKRCTKCVLPETMPYINFDDDGVCNYCANYTPVSCKGDITSLKDALNRYKEQNDNRCIVPFSGGRDSCFALHLICKELEMEPITYTYDWGMVTDLGRRNISRMCQQLGVENIVIAADISKKRDNIRKNLAAWLDAPHLGLISLLTAGDKHFYRHVESVRRETGVSLNIWGVNPLETTHFKTGFLGIPPEFANQKVYVSGAAKQLEYQKMRFKAMMSNRHYFNASLLDTLSGEYFRSIKKQEDYIHLFDFYAWEEREVNQCLNDYEWERAPDTNSTWRIGDGTAAFYNYVYYTVAGFTEHDTFRSNQIRQGQLTRSRALQLIKDENRPRSENIKWYLDSVGIDPIAAIKTVNKIPKIHRELA